MSPLSCFLLLPRAEIPLAGEGDSLLRRGVGGITLKNRILIY